MNNVLTYSYEDNWLLVNGQKVLFIKDATPEMMQLKVQEYQQEADKMKDCLNGCVCSSH